MNNGNKDFFMAYSADLTPAAGEFHTPPVSLTPVGMMASEKIENTFNTNCENI